MGGVAVIVLGKSGMKVSRDGTKVSRRGTALNDASRQHQAARRVGCSRNSEQFREAA
jgi:hypothetical protein